MRAIVLALVWLVSEGYGRRYRRILDRGVQVPNVDTNAFNHIAPTRHSVVEQLDPSRFNSEMAPLEAVKGLLFAFSSPAVKLQGRSNIQMRNRVDETTRQRRDFTEYRSFPAPRRSRAAVIMKTSRDSVDDLLIGPTATLINELASPHSNLTLTPSAVTKCLDAVCEYASVGSALKPEEDIALQNDLKRTYTALQQKGILRGFGSCASALAPLSETFSTQDQERETGLPVTSFAPGGGLDGTFLFGSAVALGLMYGSFSLELDPRLIGGAVLAALAADRIALRSAVFESIVRTVRPAYRETVILHEAGHFLVAYLLGNPIQSCLLDAWSAMKDGRVGGVAAGTVFFDPELGGGMLSGRLTRECIDRYSIVAMAGIAAEAMANGKAEGGKADESALIQLLSSLDQGRAWDITRIQNQARWAGTQAFLLIRDHESAYKSLTQALREGASIGEAVMVIENALMGSELPSESRKRQLADWNAQQTEIKSSVSLPPISPSAPERREKSPEEIAKRLADIEKRLSELDDTVN